MDAPKQDDKPTGIGAKLGDTINVSPTVAMRVVYINEGKQRLTLAPPADVRLVEMERDPGKLVILG